MVLQMPHHMTRNISTSGASRQRRYRERQKANTWVLEVPANHPLVSEAMRLAGFLPEEKIFDRDAVSRVAAEILGAWALRVTMQDDLEGR